MTFYYYTKNSTNIFNSLKRFSSYVFNRSLHPITSNFLLSDKDILCILLDEKENNELLNYIVENVGLVVVTLGVNDKSSINIINFAGLKNSFQKIIDGNFENLKPLFTEEEMKEKLKNFFHSHGEDSLFEYLNWTIYYLREGPILLITKDISYQDYQEKFLEIGLKNWNLFKNRYLKYKYFIKLSNFTPKFDDLDNIISDADNYVGSLKKMNKQETLEKNKKYFREEVGKFIIIAELLTEIYKEYQLGDSKLQNTTS